MRKLLLFVLSVAIVVGGLYLLVGELLWADKLLYWVVLAGALLVPQPLRDWCYDRVALNRYLLFGRRDECLVPTPELRRRFL